MTCAAVRACWLTGFVPPPLDSSPQGVDRRDSKAAENRRLVEAGLGKFTS